MRKKSIADFVGEKTSLFKTFSNLFIANLIVQIVGVMIEIFVLNKILPVYFFAFFIWSIIFSFIGLSIGLSILVVTQQYISIIASGRFGKRWKEFYSGSGIKLSWTFKLDEEKINPLEFYTKILYLIAPFILINGLLLKVFFTIIAMEKLTFLATIIAFGFFILLILSFIYFLYQNALLVKESFNVSMTNGFLSVSITALFLLLFSFSLLAFLIGKVLTFY